MLHLFKYSSALPCSYHKELVILRKLVKKLLISLFNVSLMLCERTVHIEGNELDFFHS